VPPRLRGPFRVIHLLAHLSFKFHGRREQLTRDGASQRRDRAGGTRVNRELRPLPAGPTGLVWLFALPMTWASLVGSAISASPRLRPSVLTLERAVRIVLIPALREPGSAKS